MCITSQPSSALIEFLILALKKIPTVMKSAVTIKLLANIKESTLYPILKN